MSDRYYVRNRFLEACRWSGDAQLSIDLNSGYEEHRPRLTLIIGRLYATLRVPKWVAQPWDETRREFGVSLAADHLRVKYGIQADSWPGDKMWSYYFPWMKWRSIEARWLDLAGAISEVVPDRADYEARTAAKERAPAMRFSFKDFDGELIEATVRMEDFVHARGGWAWLERLLPHRVGRRYDIEFSKETGTRKGSWKGGAISCNGPALPGELHLPAFVRYAADNRMTNVVLLS